MSAFRTVYSKSSAFTFTRLVYFHCISKENLAVYLKGFSCACLACKEVHVSYLTSLSKRRVCIIPEYVGGKKIEDLLKVTGSPALVRIKSSCDITVSPIIVGLSVYLTYSVRCNGVFSAPNQSLLVRRLNKFF